MSGTTSSAIKNNIKYEIKNPAKAWFNYLISAKICYFSDWLGDVFSSIIGTGFWNNSRYDLIHKWLNLMCAYPQGEFLTISPAYLKKSGYKPDNGDEIWYWRTSDRTWEHMFGRAGYCIMRNEVVVWSIITEMN